MKNITTPRGHRVIKINMKEMLKFSHIPPVCDYCNSALLGDNYYIGVLNAIYCDKCYERFAAEAKFYSSDVPFENTCIKRISNLLSAKENEVIGIHKGH